MKFSTFVMIAITIGIVFFLWKRYPKLSLSKPVTSQDNNIPNDTHLRGDLVTAENILKGGYNSFFEIIGSLFGTFNPIIKPVGTERTICNNLIPSGIKINPSMNPGNGTSGGLLTTGEGDRFLGPPQKILGGGGKIGWMPPTPDCVPVKKRPGQDFGPPPINPCGLMITGCDMHPIGCIDFNPPAGGPCGVMIN